MPRSKQGNKRENVSVENLQQAIKLVQENGLSVRTAAKQCNVSRTTLQRHFGAHLESGDAEFSYKNNCSIRQVFSNEEQLDLRDYLLTASLMHYGLSKEDVKKLAYQFAKANTKTYPASWNTNCQAGEQWLLDFRKRNPELSLRTPRPTSIARATGFNKPIVKMFFDKYSSVLEKHKLTPDRLYNMDETGISSVHTPPKILASKKIKQVGGITSTERGFNTTMIACINAVGNALPPVFVFPRVNFKSHMLHGAPPGSLGTCNPSGWSTMEIFLDFLDHFIKHVKPNKDNKVLLILDNHETHISIEAINKARDNGIVMLTIPPHTSHKLQPLDRGVFGPLKSYYNDACKSWFLTNPGKPLTIYDVAGICGKAYPLAFTPSNIISGFSSSGLWPFNQHIFAEHEYFASLVTDRPNPESRLTSENAPCVGPSDSVISTPQDKPTMIETPKSLEEIRPFPKAERKNITKKGRKPGSCRILTDTPEKNEIAADAVKRKKKPGLKKTIGLKGKQNKSKTALFGDDQQQKTAMKKRKKEDSASDDSLASFLSSEESNIGIQDLIERYEIEQQEEGKDDEIFSELPIKNQLNKWVLVAFSTKTSIKHYVGQITDVNQGNPVVKFARRLKKTSIFVWPQEDDESEVQQEDIIVFLPSPVLGRRGELSFPVSFSGFNVC